MERPYVEPRFPPMLNENAERFDRARERLARTTEIVRSQVENPIPRISLRDVLVDFLGGLVPGLVFVSTSALILGWPTLFLVNALSSQGGGSPYPPFRETIQDLSTVAEAFWIELLIFTLVLSYVMGHIFYRQDPKEPDKESFTNVREALEKNSQLGSWVVRDVEHCEFPYPNLRRYLEFRGLNHLAALVPWRVDHDVNSNATLTENDLDLPPRSNPAISVGEPEARGQDRVSSHTTGALRRTKNFVNILKIRMAFYFPEKMGPIARNEAHVRLMSSTWYMARALRNISVCGLFFWALIVLILELGHYLPTRVATNFSSLIQFVTPAIVSGAVLIAATKTRKTIQKFLHYQRVREIVYVLETAYTASLTEPLIFHGLPVYDGATDARSTRTETNSERVAAVSRRQNDKQPQEDAEFLL